MKYKFIILISCLLFSLNSNQLYSQCNCSGITDANCLKFCLDNGNPGDVFTISNDIDLSQLTNQADLPLVVPYGVTLQGGYNPLSTPLGTMIYHDNYRGNYDPLNKNEMFLLQLTGGSGGSCNQPPCSTVIRNIRIRGASSCWQEFNTGRFVCTNGAPDISIENNKYCGGIYIESHSPSVPYLDPIVIENCEVFNFNRAAVESYGEIDQLLIKNSFIHHISGSSFVGIGYGVWARLGISNGNNSFIIENTIFDDCKDAVDGTANSDIIPLNWNFNNITLNYFAGGVNRHNNSDGIPFEKSFNSLSDFIYIPKLCSSNLHCKDNLYTIDVCDKSPGNITIENSVFHNDGISLPYPGAKDSGGNHPYFLNVNNNTFTMSKSEKDPFCVTPHNCYLKISDNYVENSCFDQERSTNQFSNSGTINYFSYNKGQPTGIFPQPPYFKGTLTDNSQSPLPKVKVGSNMVYTQSGAQLLLTPQVMIGSTNGHSFVMRSNSANKIATSNDNTSGNNYYFDEQLHSSTPNPVLSFSGYNKPGLYGIDLMGFDKASRLTSDWQHFPVVVLPNPPSDLDQKLIFHIKDSYQEFHHNQIWQSLIPNGCGPLSLPSTFQSNATGIYKQVELNGQAIWREDIALGGDGWERILVDLTLPNPLINNAIPLSLLNTDGVKNTISFSIAFDNNANNQIDVRLINGLLVWVDDVYLKKTGSDTGDNLVPDGTIEESIDATDLPTTNPSSVSHWYRKIAALIPEFEDCTPQTFGVTRWVHNEDFVDLPESSSSQTCNTPTSRASVQVGTAERKSGLQSIQLKLPRFEYGTPDIDCSTYAICSNINATGFTSVVGAYTDIDFTDLLSCNDVLPSGPNLLGFLNLPCPLISSPLAGNYYLDQLCVVNNNVSLESCVIAMGPNASFSVPSGQSLTINNNNSKISHFFACGAMWEGIVNSGGNIDIHGGPANHNKIEDAKIAVYSNGGTVKLYFTDFKDNYVDISLEGNYPYPVNTIYGNNLSNTNSVLAKFPHFGDQTYSRLKLNNVSDLDIGIPSGGIYSNYLTNAIFGVHSTNSNFTIYSSNFSEIKNQNTSCRSCSADIYSISNDGINHTINIGDINTSQNIYQNTFNDSQLGVYLSGPTNATIKGNKFSQISQAGIQIVDNYYSNIVIDNNQGFESVNIGISISSISDCTIDLHSNTFNSELLTNLPSSFYNTAITVQGARNTPVYIYDNLISDYRIGIHANGVDGINVGSGPPGSGNLASNTILFNLGSTPTITDFYSGIWLQNCRDAIVLGNSVSNNFEVTTPGVNNFRGLDLEVCSDSWISCNYFYNLPRSMNLYATCENTFLQYNTMQGYEHAINLDDVTLPNQFKVNPNTGDPLPLENTWNDIPLQSPSTTDRVTGTLSGVNPIEWFRQPGVVGLNPYDPRDSGMNSAIINNPVANGSPIACEDFNHGHDRIERFGSLIGDSLQFLENDNENLYHLKSCAFKAIQNDTSLLFQNNLLDTEFQQFYYELSNTNIGVLDSVDQLSGDTNLLAQAIILNESINDTNTIEYYSKLINGIRLNNAAINAHLSNVDSTICDFVSTLPYVNVGDAKYEAAIQIFKEIHPIYFPLRIKKQDELDKSNSTYSEFNVTPNPATTSFCINGDFDTINTLELYDFNGRMIKRIVRPTQNMFYINDMATGLYQIKLFDQSERITYLKLAVVR